jgi:hypothetical protein
MGFSKKLLHEILKEGNASVLEEYTKYTQRLVVKFRCVCGEVAEKKFEMLNLYRLPYCKECSLKKSVERSEQTCMEKYGVKNVTYLQETKDKTNKTYMERFGDHPKRTKEVHEKWLNTCIEKYGGHPNQNRDVQIKAEQNSYKFKEFIMPSGKIIKYQGYENLAIIELLKVYDEKDIHIGRGEVPIIKYTSDKKERVYFPDIYIKSINKIIEVKSEWTVKLQSARIDDRAKSVKEAGYAFEVWIYNDKKVKTKTQIF